MAHNKKHTHTKGDWLLNSDKYSIMHLLGAHGWRIQIYYVQSTNTDIRTYMLSYTVEEEWYMSLLWKEHGENVLKFLGTAISVSLTVSAIMQKSVCLYIFTPLRQFRPKLRVMVEDSPGEVLDIWKREWDRVRANVLPHYYLCKKSSGIGRVRDHPSAPPCFSQTAPRRRKL
jgi:hypothetical protein